MYESTIPFLVDARDWARLPARYHEEIQREHVVLAEGAASPQKTLGDYFTLQRGTTYKSRLLDEDGPVLLGLASIRRNGGFRRDALRTYGGDCPEKLLVRPGELYVSLKDVTQSADLLGSVAMLPAGHGPGRLTQDTVKLEPKWDDVPLDYFHWLLRTPDYRRYCRAHATGTTNLRLPREDFLAYPVPPLTSRRRNLLDALNALEHKIALNHRMNETLDVIARALFQSWFVDFDPVRTKMAGQDWGLPPATTEIFPARLAESGIGSVPEGWNVSEIGQEVAAVGGGTPSTRVEAYWEAGTHAWATPKDLSALMAPVLLDTAKKVTDAGLDKISSGLLPVGTVLMSSRAPIGYVAIAETPVAINQGFIAMVCEKRLPNLYVLFWCRQNLRHIKNIAGGSTFAEISKKAFRPLPVLVPPPDVIESFLRIARPLYARIAANVKEAKSVGRVRDTLLPKLISGELRVPDAERIVESAT